MDEVVPINWIHLSSDRKKIIVNSSDNESPPSPTGLLLFTVEPLGDGEGAEGNYDCTKTLSHSNPIEGRDYFPGPLTLALPVNDDSEISELAQKGMNTILNSLQRLIDSEIEEVRDGGNGIPYYKSGFEFTVEPLGEERIKNHPDAIMGVLCTDGGNVEDEDYEDGLPMPLYRVWIMLYRWVKNEEGQWTWR